MEPKVGKNRGGQTGLGPTSRGGSKWFGASPKILNRKRGGAGQVHEISGAGQVQNFEKTCPWPGPFPPLI